VTELSQEVSQMAQISARSTCAYGDFWQRERVARVPDGAFLVEQDFDLLQSERVAFDGGGVMGLLEPDVPPDLLIFDGLHGAESVP
jgi:hypothetical protein